ncbi:glycosyltransferase [Aphanothece hegewaldii CCALA 016]|uniref:Glycosyltransferase n=1 Tax=Aphanothece hegewaldii CCALA 016 TaxID=2107694 RepID=A0A2T1M0E4_9CHRO|nr:glycosyltransferase family 2 protein [Aphanothece hegewaldii]PSF38141.1 glycosyltransferase [Aphanothece hegewaldii CCALA 016]
MNITNEVYYTIIIPIFNEEETLWELWNQLKLVLDSLEGDSEVIFVNDGSIDQSLTILKTLSEQYKEIKIISLSRNFGHQCALSAGIDHARGRCAILMDGDLQDSPQAIFDFVEKWKDGYEVVYAIRRKRKENWIKRLGFVTFYRILNVLSGFTLPLDAGIFSLIDQKVVLALRNMPERNKYLTGLRAYAGFKQTGILVERGPRYRGEPRVTPVKLVKLAFDGILSFSVVPLRIATLLGFISAGFSLILGLIGLYSKWVLGQEFLSWSFGLTTTFFMGGVQLIFLGIIGEYIGRIYEEIKQRPYYIVDQIIECCQNQIKP